MKHWKRVDGTEEWWASCPGRHFEKHLTIALGAKQRKLSHMTDTYLPQVGCFHLHSTTIWRTTGEARNSAKITSDWLYFDFLMSTSGINSYCLAASSHNSRWCRRCEGGEPALGLSGKVVLQRVGILPRMGVLPHFTLLTLFSLGHQKLLYKLLL